MNILVICNLQEDILERYSSDIAYMPSLSDYSPSVWEEAIKLIKPKVILFGTGYFTKEMIRIWRKYLPDDQLSIVRKGINLSRCDLDSAQHYSINVLNTPGVNSQYVADYMNKFLFEGNSKPDAVGIIGVGRIGTIVLRKAEKYAAEIFLYSRSLKNIEQLKFLDMSRSNLHVASSIEQLITNSNKIAIAIPLNENTKGIINIRHIDLIQEGSMLVSVSSPYIFTEEALCKLYNRFDVNVVIDYLKSELDEVHKIICNNKPLRNSFLMDEKAAAGLECQKAMSIAAIEKCLSLIK